jgi:hypothetical protein
MTTAMKSKANIARPANMTRAQLCELIDRQRETIGALKLRKMELTANVNRDCDTIAKLEFQLKGHKVDPNPQLQTDLAAMTRRAEKAERERSILIRLLSKASRSE